MIDNGMKRLGGIAEHYIDKISRLYILISTPMTQDHQEQNAWRATRAVITVH